MMPWRAKYIVAAYTAPFLYALWIDLNFYRRLLLLTSASQDFFADEAVLTCCPIYNRVDSADPETRGGG